MQGIIFFLDPLQWGRLVRLEQKLKIVRKILVARHNRVGVYVPLVLYD